MTKQIVAPEEFLELVNQAIKEHPDYSEERPITLKSFDKTAYHITYAGKPPQELDKQIFKDALAKVKENYQYKFASDAD